MVRPAWTRYIVPQRYPATIAVGNDRNRFEGITYRFDDQDKKVQYRNYDPAGAPVISVDEAGNLLRDEPVKFDYNRELAFRIPVQDATGKPVGESTRGNYQVSRRAT